MTPPPITSRRPRLRPWRRGLPAAAAAVAAAGALAQAAIATEAPAPLPVQLGPRPAFLADDLRDGPLKQTLQACARQARPVTPRRFSIGHRGAPLQFPEHTRESYLAAARMGAGIIECDVTFTKDHQLVCRHAQDDLHTSTDILATPLAARCHRPFQPAQIDAAGKLLRAASAECRTSDLTLAEFKTLRGKMDGANPRATTVAEYLAGTAPWRTELYAGTRGGTLMSHRESIALFQQLGVMMTPELKAPVVAMPVDGYTQQAYARQMIQDYVDAGVPPARVWPQSFDKRDVLFWLRETPDFGRQAVYLDRAGRPAELPDAAALAALRAEGVRIWAPPLFALLALDEQQRIVPSAAARAARAAGLELITWTLERSGPLAGAKPGFYTQTIHPALQRDGDILQALHVLAQDVGVLGVFSDWPATTTFYADCLGLP